MQYAVALPEDHAGIPLITADGHVLGAPWTIDDIPPLWTSDLIDARRHRRVSVSAESNRRRPEPRR